MVGDSGSGGGPPLVDGSTEDLIRPILVKTYGDGGMTRALAVCLAERIDAGQNPYGRTRSREDMVMRTCWDWFSGGGTAESVAKKIEAALEARS